MHWPWPARHDQQPFKVFLNTSFFIRCSPNLHKQTPESSYRALAGLCSSSFSDSGRSADMQQQLLAQPLQVVRAPAAAPPSFRRKLRPVPLKLDESAEVPVTARPSPARLGSHVVWLAGAQPQLDATAWSRNAHHSHRALVVRGFATLQAPGSSPLGYPAVPVVASPAHVRFQSPLHSTIVVTPYAQVYGIHPRFFQVDAQGAMIPTPKAEAGLLGKAGLTATDWLIGNLPGSPPAECLTPACRQPPSPGRRRCRGTPRG